MRNEEETTTWPLIHSGQVRRTMIRFCHLLSEKTLTVRIIPRDRCIIMPKKKVTLKYQAMETPFMFQYKFGKN